WDCEIGGCGGACGSICGCGSCSGGTPSSPRIIVFCRGGGTPGRAPSARPDEPQPTGSRGGRAPRVRRAGGAARGGEGCGPGPGGGTVLGRTRGGGAIAAGVAISSAPLPLRTGLPATVEGSSSSTSTSYCPAAGTWRGGRAGEFACSKRKIVLPISITSPFASR